MAEQHPLVGDGEEIQCFQFLEGAMFCCVQLGCAHSSEQPFPFQPAESFHHA